MKHTSESGRGRLSSLFWLAVLAAVIYAMWSVGPLYYANYMLKDKMEDMARIPRGARAEAIMQKAIREAINDSGLRDYLSETDFRVSMVDVSRSITVEYEREANILPGWPHVFRFVNKVEGRVF